MSERVQGRRRLYTTRNPELDRIIHQLVQKAGGSPDEEFLKEIIVTALKIQEDDLERGDIKLINSTLKEMRYAFKVFYPYRHLRKAVIFGSARTPKSAADYRLARAFAREIARRGWMVITGAADGIMKAGNEGAGRAKSFGLNIRLPFEQEANPVIADDPKLISFKYFFTRKLIFIRESDATVLLPGGFGTHDEAFETLTLIQTGKTTPRPLVCLDPPGSGYWAGWLRFVRGQLLRREMIGPEDLKILKFTHDPKEAAEILEGFYRNFHSMRYIQDRLVLRLKYPLSREQMARLQRRFHGLLRKGKFEQYPRAFEEEKNEPHTHPMARLAFYFDRRQFAGLYDLIAAINEV